MATYTTNYKLNKVEGTENSFEVVFTEGNQNLDKIDELIKTQETNLNNHKNSASAHDGSNLSYGGKLGSQSITSAIDKVQINLDEYIDYATNQYAEMMSAEEIRKINENDRILKENTRQANESIRVDIFNTNETSRSNTFSANELSRQSIMTQFQNWYNTSSLTGKLPFIIDGGDYGDTNVGSIYDGGDY